LSKGQVSSCRCIVLKTYARGERVGIPARPGRRGRRPCRGGGPPAGGLTARQGPGRVDGATWSVRGREGACRGRCSGAPAGREHEGEKRSHHGRSSSHRCLETSVHRGIAETGFHRGFAREAFAGVSRSLAPLAGGALRGSSLPQRRGDGHSGPRLAGSRPPRMPIGPAEDHPGDHDARRNAVGEGDLAESSGSDRCRVEKTRSWGRPAGSRSPRRSWRDDRLDQKGDEDRPAGEAERAQGADLAGAGGHDAYMVVDGAEHRPMPMTTATKVARPGAPARAAPLLLVVPPFGLRLQLHRGWARIRGRARGSAAPSCARTRELLSAPAGKMAATCRSRPTPRSRRTPPVDSKSPRSVSASAGT